MNSTEKKPVEGLINEPIDDAYRAKYHGSQYLSAMINAHARSATSRASCARAMPDGRSIMQYTCLGRSGFPDHFDLLTTRCPRPTRFGRLLLRHRNASLKT